MFSNNLPLNCYDKSYSTSRFPKQLQRLKQTKVVQLYSISVATPGYEILSALQVYILSEFYLTKVFGVLDRLIRYQPLIFSLKFPTSSQCPHQNSTLKCRLSSEVLLNETLTLPLILLSDSIRGFMI